MSSNLGPNSFGGLKRLNSSGKDAAASATQTSNQQQKSIIEIYTDWANHYLDKLHGGRKKIKDLQSELQDGLILAEVIEAVTASKVPDVVKKPKSNGQMVDNIQASLTFLAKRGVAVGDIHAVDIRDGNLKAILGLFFQLSRYKQQQKMLMAQDPRSQGTSTPKIPSVPPSPARTATSAIPSPIKVGQSKAKSFLPAPQQKSMLEKLKGRSNGGVAPPPPMRDVQRGLGKRTSSSSGFSSARSIGSESSISLSSDTNFPSPSALRRINEGQPSSPKSSLKRTPPTTVYKDSSPKRSPKLQRAGTEIKDYGPIDQQLEHYPPHHASNAGVTRTQLPMPTTGSPSRIPNPKVLGSGLRQPSKIPGSKAAVAASTTIDATAESLPQGCSVRPLQLDKETRGRETVKEPPASIKEATTSENDESTAQMTASFHSRTKSLPRTKRREDGSPGPANVAVVSPMPAKYEHATQASSACHEAEATLEASSGCSSLLMKDASANSNHHVRDDSLLSNMSSEDPLKSLVLLGPLGLFSTSRPSSVGSCASRPTHHLPFSSRIGTGVDQMSSGTTIAGTTMFQTSGVPNNGIDGYMSDGDAFALKTCHSSQYQQQKSPPSQSSIDDGYLSEGGASFYARKIQSRIALEKQKTVEEQNKKLEEVYGKAAARRPLPGLPDILGAGDQSNKMRAAAAGGGAAETGQIYRVVGGRKHIQKSEAGMQTDTNSIKQPVQDHYDWKQAMAYNAKVLSSQEKAMDEYLRRQRSTAEQHINQMQHAGPYGAIDPRHARAHREGIVRLQDVGQQPVKMPLTGVGPRLVPSSTPATPTGRRRNNQQDSNSRNGSPSRQYQRGPIPENLNENGVYRQGGGSLERKPMKIKVSGGTQTYVVSDSEYGQYMGSPGSCRKSYSQSPTPTPTAAAAAAATTTIVNNGGQTGQQRDGVFGSRSLPKGASSLNYGLMIDRIQQKRQQRQFNPKVHDGSLSDSNYVAYEAAARASSPYSWLQPASTYAANIAHHSTADPYQQQQVRPLEEVSTMSSDILASNESLNSVSSSIQQARANSLTKARLILHQQQHQRASMTNNGAKISTRSNVSEKSYSSLSTAARTDQETEYYGIPFGIRNRSSATGSNINNNSSHLTSPNKAESTYLSLAPIGSEESQTDAEIFKLRRELADEHSKVLNLTSQLATNCHVVSAFEQSLANMTARLQQLTATSEKKDLELNELRRNIEIFRQSGVDAGLITAGHTDQYGELVSDSGDEGGLSSLSSKSKKGTPKRSGWLRNSFSKAFTKPGNSNKKKNSLGGGSVSESEGDSCHGTPKHQPRHQQQQHPVYNGRSASALSGQINNVPMSPIKASRSTDTIDDSSNPVPPEVVNELQRQLMEKENLLTETRLEALSSAHQLESLRDTVTKMRNELMSVKYENEKLHTMVTMTSHKSLSSSQTSLNKIGNDNHPNDNGNDAERRHSSTLSETSILSGPSSLDLSATTDPTNREGGKLVPVSVLTTDKAYTRIGTISVSGRTNWDLIDSLVHRLFKEYVMRVDPTSNLGLSADSIGHYQVGEIRRTNMSRKPELLPYGYIVGDTTDIMISLRRSDPTSESVHVDALAFETLTPKSIIQRYVSLLLEHKRVIFSGPSGAGKTFMANKLANFLVSKSKKSIATFAVQRNNVPELKDFLQRIASNGSDQESNVIILDNLQHAGRLDEVLSDCILPTSSYIIGTLNQSGQGVQTPTNLQLQHNFRFVQHSTHTEPLRGLVGRCLRQRLLSIETKTRMQDGEMSAAVDWVARIHQHLNRVLESHASGDATLAPALFLDCPIGTDGGPEAQGEQVRRWFLQLWNGELHIKITESIKEGIQMYGHRAHWEDPVQFLIDSWPWANSVPIELKRIHPIDVGYDARKFPDVQVAANKLVVGSSSGDRPSSTGTSISSGSGTNTTTDSDPLFNMLLHLQEAANNGSK